MSYNEFLASKLHNTNEHGFKPTWLPDWLFDFQKYLVEWAIHKGRGAVFAGTGLGKTPMQLVWAQNVLRKINKPVLIVTPLAVAAQTVREGEKFGIECKQTRDGKIYKGTINVTNYEQLHKFDNAKIGAMVSDEAGILKNVDGVTRDAVVEFMRPLIYRLLCSATPAPNDYVELGNSSEALGELGYMDMLGRFFKNDQNSLNPMRRHNVVALFADCEFRFKKHAEIPFWRWVCTWARATRKPSDLGFDDGPFELPPLRTREVMVDGLNDRAGFGLRIAKGLQEQRQERAATVEERCEKAAEILSKRTPSLGWCHLNREGDLLEQLVSGAVQVSGSDPDEKKEERFLAFADGQIKTLITKPRIAGFGLNWQHCSNVTYFPSHSFEQWYQAVRRCWRFGQKKRVDVAIITSPGERGVLRNLKRKADAAERMFEQLVRLMHDAEALNADELAKQKVEAPSWL